MALIKTSEAPRTFEILGIDNQATMANCSLSGLSGDMYIVLSSCVSTNTVQPTGNVTTTSGTIERLTGSPVVYGGPNSNWYHGALVYKLTGANNATVSATGMGNWNASTMLALR